MNIDRKTIYIIIIIVCVAATAAILYSNFSSPSAPPDLGAPTVAQTDNGNAAAAPVTNGKTGSVNYPVPKVFPNDTKFDWTVLDDDNFKSLETIPDLTLDPAEVGRPNPFAPY